MKVLNFILFGVALILLIVVSAYFAYYMATGLIGNGIIMGIATITQTFVAFILAADVVGEA